MKLAVAVLVLAVVSLGRAQQAYKCESPKVWYGDFLDFDTAEVQERRGKVFYDEPNLRIAIREEEISGSPNNISYYWEIFDHKNNIGYRIENRTKYCEKFTLTEEFPIIGPYLSDEYDGELYIGSEARPKDGVKVVIYSGSIPERGSFYGVWIPVDETTCLPVSETFRRETSDSSHTRRHYNLRLGEFDTTVFDPPEVCREKF